MTGSMYLAASGAILQQTKLEILANNVANINTPGYREDLPIFRLPENSVNQKLNNDNQDYNRRQKIQPYTPPFAIRTDFSSGPIKPTGNVLDLALSGDGFFTIQTAEGIRYTRQGNFSLNEEGLLVTQSGDPVMGQGAEISMEGRQVSVGLDGTIEVDGEVVDQIRIVRFDDVSQIKKVGNTMFEPADGLGAEIEMEAENTSVNQGYLEMSNVAPIRAMTGMIEALRVSQVYQKVIQAADEATSKTVNDVSNG